MVAVDGNAPATPIKWTRWPLPTQPSEMEEIALGVAGTQHAAVNGRLACCASLKPDTVNPAGCA